MFPDTDREFVTQQTVMTPHRRRPHSEVRVRSGAVAAEEAPDLGDQVERHLDHHAVLGRAGGGHAASTIQRSNGTSTISIFSARISCCTRTGSMWSSVPTCSAISCRTSALHAPARSALRRAAPAHLGGAVRIGLLSRTLPGDDAVLRTCGVGAAVGAARALVLAVLVFGAAAFGDVPLWAGADCRPGRACVALGGDALEQARRRARRVGPRGIPLSAHCRRPHRLGGVFVRRAPWSSRCGRPGARDSAPTCRGARHARRARSRGPAAVDAGELRRRRRRGHDRAARHGGRSRDGARARNDVPGGGDVHGVPLGLGRLGDARCARHASAPLVLRGGRCFGVQRWRPPSAWSRSTWSSPPSRA